MPYDEDGNWIDPEDSTDTEGDQAAVATASPDMAEYLRRAQLQSQMSSSGAPTSAQYTPAPVGPQEEKFRKLETQAPIKQNFPVSGLRRGLGMLAGAVSGNPSVREGITDYKFNKAQSDFQQKLGIQQTLAAEEEAATKRYNDAILTGNRSEAEAARRKAEEARGKRYEWMISPEGQDFELKKTQLMHPGTAVKPEYHEAELNDGSKVQLVRTPDGRLKNVDTGEMVLPSAIKQLSDPGKSLKASTSDIKGVLAEDVQAHKILQEETEKPGTHSQFEVDAAKEYIKSRTSGRDPQDSFNVVVRAMESEGKGKGKDGKLTSDQMIRLRNMMPEQRPPQELGITPSGEAIRVAPGTKVPEGTVTGNQAGQMNMPTAATRGRAQQANVVIDAGNDLKQFIAQNQAKLGNVDSYWKQFVNGTPMSDPTIAEFQTRLASYAALQAAAHGFRGSNVMKDFEGKIGGPAKNPAAIVAAINGIESTMKELQKSGGANFGNAGPQGGEQRATKRYNPATGRIEAIK